VLLVLTVSVSLAIVCAPAPVGVTFAVTVPLLVKTLITEPIAELIVVDVVAAPAAVGIATAPANMATANIMFWLFLGILMPEILKFTF
jgi:hypothetical protein